MRDLKTAVLLISCAVPTPMIASAGETLDRMGRTWGFGWGDGYHACSSDCYRIGENLPPRSYSATHALHPVSSRRVVTNHAPPAGCADGNCSSGSMPQWQTATPSAPYFSPEFPADPVPLHGYQGSTSIDAERASIPKELIPAPAPAPVQTPEIMPSMPSRTPDVQPVPKTLPPPKQLEPLLDDDDDLLAPPAPRNAMPLDDDDDDLLLEPDSPSDSDLGGYLNSPLNQSPYRTTVRPVQNGSRNSHR